MKLINSILFSLQVIGCAVLFTLALMFIISGLYCIFSMGHLFLGVMIMTMGLILLGAPFAN
jgi:hypothetical protein